MDQFQAISLGPHSAVISESSLRQRFRTTVVVRSGMLGGSVVALGALAAALSTLLHISADSAETIAMLETIFGLVSAVCALCAVVLVPLILPTHASHAATPCARQFATPAANAVAGCLFSRAIISGALAEVPALLGFILFVSGADAAVYLGFVTLTIVTSLLTFPRWAVWEPTVNQASSEGPGIS